MIITDSYIHNLSSCEIKAWEKKSVWLKLKEMKITSLQKHLEPSPILFNN